jgi:two-component system nitrogen regulation sensor histidine kinase NtrY
MNGSKTPEPNLVLILILVDLVVILAATTIIARKIFSQSVLRKNLSGETKLQNKVVLMFSLVAAVPTVIISVFSALFFNYGIESWFDTRVSTAIESSIAVADSYLAEHTEVIRRDVLFVAREIDNKSYVLRSKPDLLEDFLSHQASLRSLTEAFLLQHDHIVARTKLSYALSLTRLPPGAEEKARKGDIVVFRESDNKVRALIKLETIPDTYLIVGRFIDSTVLTNIKNTKIAVTSYLERKADIADSKIRFSLVFVIISFFLLLITICVGVVFANAIAYPINKLVQAAERVKHGDLTVIVDEGANNDEITVLTRAFNVMTKQLGHQRDNLTSAYHELDAKRHFSETVLSGVSAGVIAVGTDRIITLVNKSAAQLLAITSEDATKQSFKALCPEMDQLLEQVTQNPDQHVQGELSVIRNRKKLILLVRIIAEKLQKNVVGYVITFDDVTALVLAERSAAWSDVARRVAHEIKNPLTPIHLAAERIKKKYGNEVADVETLVKYTNTIIRHVTDINKMVEEFVNFARMRAPVFEQCNLSELIRNAVFSRQCIGSSIDYQLDMPEIAVYVSCDIGQFNQALINLLKNAEESIEGKESPVNGFYIRVSLEISASNYVVITIDDNGKGFGEDIFHRLTEPYVTTRAKGNGLGLAIVKKIMDDHNALLTFDNNIDHGATIKITLPIKL